MCRRIFGVIVNVLLSYMAFKICPVVGRPEHELNVAPDELALGRSLEKPDLRREFSATPIINKRNWEHHITDCIHMTSEEGDFYQKAKEVDGKACGVYIFSEPDQNIHIQFNYLDVPCENGGLVAVVDGWELNRELFPSPRDHTTPLTSRFKEFCGQNTIKQTFISSQNVALIQYRMPSRRSSFSFNVRFVKNPNPCNVLLQTGDIYTLRNYGKKTNCSLSTLSPAVVKVADLNVGITPTVGAGMKIETGIIHKCPKRGLDDYVQIGGSSGLDNANSEIAGAICGLSSKPGKHANTIACDTTSVRLVSSGEFDNSVTIYLRQLSDMDLDGYMDVICVPDDMRK